MERLGTTEQSEARFVATHTPKLDVLYVKLLCKNKKKKREKQIWGSGVCGDTINDPPPPPLLSVYKRDKF